MPTPFPGMNPYLERRGLWEQVHADCYLEVRDPIPEFHVPLRLGETEPTLPLNQILHNLYEQGGDD